MKNRIDLQTHVWRGLSLWHLLAAAGILILFSLTLWYRVHRNAYEQIEVHLVNSTQGEAGQLVLPLPESDALQIVEGYLGQDSGMTHVDLVSPLYAIPDMTNITDTISFSFYRDAPLLSLVDLFCLVDGSFIFVPSELQHETGDVIADGAGGICGLFSVTPGAYEIIEVRQSALASDSSEGALVLQTLSANGEHDLINYVPYKAYLEGDIEGRESAISRVLIDLRKSTLTDAEWQALAGEPIHAAVYLPSNFDGNTERWEILMSHELDARIDFYLIDLEVSPSEFVSGGEADTILSSLARLFDRRKILPIISAAPMLINAATPLGENTPLMSRLGDLEFTSESTPSGRIFSTSETIRVLGGLSEIPFFEDDLTAVYRFEIVGDHGIENIFLNDVHNLRIRLDFLAQLGFRSLGLTISPDVSDNLQSFARALAPDTPIPERTQPQVELTICDDKSGIVSQEITVPGAELSWIPDEEGEYTLTIALMYPGARWEFSDSLKIVSATSMVAQHEGVVVGAPNDLLGSTSTNLNLNLPAPVYPAGISATGDFELGGQVNHSIDNQAFMDQAGMKWVKFQIGWHADEVPDAAIQKIDLAHSLGYKVLLSIVSTEKYPTGIDIPAYLAFLRTVSSYGPDAIEIWNEPNLDYEWPRGEISGSNYVSWLLAPSYNAIKKVDPSIMVISAAPAPNGAFFGEGGCSAEGYGCDDWLFVQQMAQAGASNYMDCVGVHFNAGATSPLVTEGHPADPGFKHYSWYYSTMLQLYSGTFGRPVCFTELGYLSPAGFGGLPARFIWASDTTLMEQAMWLAEAAKLSRDSGLVRLMIVWNVDFTYWGDDPMAGYAIVRLSGECPACQTLGTVMN